VCDVYPVVCAVSIPKLDLMISLVGALTGTPISLIIPPIIEVATLAPYHLVTKWMIVRNILIMLVGIIGLVIGTTLTVMEIVDSYL